MAQTNLGRILIIWKGVYDRSIPYTKLDAVEYNGSSYLCLKPCTGISLNDTEYWACMARKGAVSLSELSTDERNQILQELSDSLYKMVYLSLDEYNAIETKDQFTTYYIYE